MFGMGFSEILIILVIGIIFLGPEKLPEAMVKIAKFFNMFKKTINEAKESIDQELKIEELRKEAMEYKKRLNETTNSVKHSIYMDEFEEIKNSTTDISKSIENNLKDTTDMLNQNTKEKEKKSKKSKKEIAKKIETEKNIDDNAKDENV